MATTSDDLMAIARAGAEKIDLSIEQRGFPSFGDVEDQCGDDYEELLDALHEDDLFQPVDLQHQEDLVEQIKGSLDEGQAGLIDDLTDNHARHLWLHQEAAFHLGMAVGLRIALGRPH
jgi:hypothetical protein